MCVIKKMSDIAFETCRICQKTVSVENVFQIFDNTCTRIFEEIIEISGVDFKGVFGQPWSFCMLCYTDLLTAQRFRRKCIESYEQTTNQNSEEFPQLEELLQEITELPPENLNDTNLIEDQFILFSNSDEGSTQQNEEYTNEKTKKSMKIKQICEICGNVFQTKKNFALHLRRHTNNKPFDCELCSNRFYTNAELKCHMRRHTGEKPYECQYCHRKFSDYGTHKKHVRTHTNDRPFSCNFCGKAFTSNFILKNHILTHTGKRDYECKVCEKSFLYLSHLSAHIKTIFHRKNCKKAELEEVDEEN